MDVSKNIKNSFHTTFVVLVFSALVTFVVAYFFTNKTIKTVLRLETAVCFVASVFYFIFIQRVNSANQIDWASLTQIRYADWFFTTPMMLISLSYFLSFNSHTVVKMTTMASVIVLNYLMLGLGYLGETDNMQHFLAMILGFIPFFIMFYIIFNNYVKNSIVNHWVFGIYLVIWSLYGIVYLLPEEQKNILTNWLDLVAKGVIGLGMTAYFLL